MHESDLAWLVDRTKIVETVYRYALGIDTLDWAMYRSIFTDEVTMDFSSWSKQPAATMTADQWVARVRPLFEGLDHSQHVLTQPVVTITGDEATCIMYMKAEHHLRNDEGDQWHAVGGHYTDHLVRVGDGWKIDAVTLTVWWNKGNRGIIALARV